MTQKNCTCGMPDCWPANDFSWLSSNSGWHGNINGCHSSVFFIHGKKIREQRDVPEGTYDINALLNLLVRWSQGLPNPRLVHTHDTGDGDWGLWIEGEREPNDEDWKRLEQARHSARQKAERDLADIRRRFPDLK